MQIRRATPADAPEVARLGRAFVASSPYAGKAEVSEDAIGRFLGVDCAALFLAEDGGDTVGGCGVVVFPLWWAEGVTLAQELFWWVEPHARGGEASKAMLAAMEDWAQEQGAAHLFMVCLENGNAERIGRLYRRAGFEPVERTFIRGISWQ